MARYVHDVREFFVKELAMQYRMITINFLSDICLNYLSLNRDFVYCGRTRTNKRHLCILIYQNFERLRSIMSNPNVLCDLLTKYPSKKNNRDDQKKSNNTPDIKSDQEEEDLEKLGCDSFDFPVFDSSKSSFESDIFEEISYFT